MRTCSASPRALAGVEDNVFESLPARAAQDWPERFIEAIPEGADLTGITDQFLLWLLQDGGSPLATWHHLPCVAGVAALHARRARGGSPPPGAWYEAKTTAAAAQADAEAGPDPESAFPLAAATAAASDEEYAAADAALWAGAAGGAVGMPCRRCCSPCCGRLRGRGMVAALGHFPRCIRVLPRYIGSPLP